MYVEVLAKMGIRYDRGDAVLAPPSTATASSSASVSVGTTTLLPTFNQTSLATCAQGRIEGKTGAICFVYDLNI